MHVKSFVSVLILAVFGISILSCASTPAPVSPDAKQDLQSTTTNFPESTEIVTKEVTYGTIDKTKLIGYLAYPKFAKNAPSVLVVHEWWGQTDYPRKRAEMLAKLGYVALAVDMYGNRAIADHPKDAQKFMQAAMQDISASEKKFKLAMDFVNKLPESNPKKQAAIGYCFGGAVVLHMARQGYDLAGVASFHGSVGTQKPAQAGKVKAQILVLNGGSDPMVSDDQIDGFKKEMEKAKVTYNFISYPGAKHGFTNPDATEKGKEFKLPLAYDAKADQQSWQAMKMFFVNIF